MSAADEIVELRSILVALDDSSHAQLALALERARSRSRGERVEGVAAGRRARRESPFALKRD